MQPRLPHFRVLMSSSLPKGTEKTAVMACMLERLRQEYDFMNAQEA